MSLYCDETKRSINFGEPLWAGTREDVDFFTALCDEVVSKIPETDRDPVPRRGTGLNIFKASSDRNMNGAYTISGFTLGDFVFSLSEEAAIKYFPNNMKRYSNPGEKRGRFKILRET